jgi:hypothetical protein
MPSQPQSTNHPSLQAEPNPETCSDSFLDKLRLLAQLAREIERDEAEAGPLPSAADALLAGPWTVREIERPEDRRIGYAVVRPGNPVLAVPSDDGPVAVFDCRPDALRFAAILAAVAAPPLHRLGAKARDRGFTLHRGRRFLAHLAPAVGGRPPEERLELSRHLDLAGHLAARPWDLALLFESTGPAALPILVRTLARNIEALMR